MPQVGNNTPTRLHHRASPRHEVRCRTDRADTTSPDRDLDEAVAPRRWLPPMETTIDKEAASVTSALPRIAAATNNPPAAFK